MGTCTLEEAMRNDAFAKTPDKRNVFGGGMTNYLVCPSLCPSCAELICDSSTNPIQCLGRASMSASHQLQRTPETRDSCAAYKAKSAGVSKSSTSSGGSILDSILPSNDLGTKVAKGLLKGTGKGLKALWKGLGKLS